MTSRLRLILLSLSVAGLVFAGAATYVHYRLLTEPNYISPCDINATFNCSELYISRFGSIAGVPVAIGGVAFFLAIGLIAGLSAPSSRSGASAGPTYIFVLSIVGLGTILYLGWASYFVLHKFCILCLGTYASVIALLAVSGAAKSPPVSELPQRLAGDLRSTAGRPASLLAAVSASAVVAILVVWFPREGSAAASAAPASTAPVGTAAASSAEENFDRIWAQQPRVPLGIPADGAKVVIVKFNDWQCPSCKAGYFAYKALLEQYAKTMPGAIKYVTKDYPLNGRCNFAYPAQTHAAACEAAAAVRLATERGKTTEMAEWLFANQDTLTPQIVESQVKSMLNVTDFAAQYPRVLPDIKRDVADGVALQIDVTPTYYVNGVKAQTPPPEKAFLTPEYFDYAIRYELRTQK